MNQQGREHDQGPLFDSYIQQRLAGYTSRPERLDSRLAQVVEDRTLVDVDHRLLGETITRISRSLDQATSAPSTPSVAVLRDSATTPRLGLLKAPALVAAAAGIILAGALVILGPLAGTSAVNAEAILGRAREAAASNTPFQPFVMESVHEIVPADPSDTRSDRLRTSVTIQVASPSEWSITRNVPAMRAGPPTGPGMPAPLLPPASFTTISNGEVVWSYDPRTGQVTTSPYSERWAMSTFPSVGNWERFRDSDSLASLLANHAECSSPRFLRMDVVAGRDAYVIDLGQYACGAEGTQSNRMTVWIDAGTYAVTKWTEQAGSATGGLISTNQIVRLEFRPQVVPDLATPMGLASLEDARSAVAFPILALPSENTLVSIQRFCPPVGNRTCLQGTDWVEARYAAPSGGSFTLTQGYFSRLGSVSQTEMKQTAGGYEIDTRSLLHILPFTHTGRFELGDSAALWVDCRALISAGGCDRSTYFGQAEVAAISWAALEPGDDRERYFTLESTELSVEDLVELAGYLR
ncbi:MAG: hypothetical protein GEU75_06350 [Dehalococcoidia bacterium]|nr:hypothetical protein [Dehalococcoidia bacterium]